MTDDEKMQDNMADALVNDVAGEAIRRIHEVIPDNAELGTAVLLGVSAVIYGMTAVQFKDDTDARKIWTDLADESSKNLRERFIKWQEEKGIDLDV